VQVHHALRAALDAVVPVEAACSIDEFRCRLTGWQAEPAAALSLAQRARELIRARVGEALRCSIGLAPNGMLAKLASGMRKPDGLTMIGRDELPGALQGLALTDFPGISGRMEARLHRHGIRCTAELCAASRAQLRAVWGGVLGEDWWHWLRGEEAGRAAGLRRSFGNQHVLAPGLRTAEGSRAVAVRLLHKAAARLRAHGSLARRLDLHVDPVDGPPLRAARRFTPTAETGDLLHWLLSIWDGAAGVPARRIGVVLGDLIGSDQAGEGLFESERARGRLGAAMDRINQRLGHAAVYYGSMHLAKDAAPRRIAFGSIPDLSLADTEIDEVPAPVFGARGSS
jgi:DNA polymerase-4